MTDNTPPQPAFGQYAPQHVPQQAQPWATNQPGEQWNPAAGLIDPTPERKGLGLSSLIIALVVFVLSFVASVLIGFAASTLIEVSPDFGEGFQSGYEAGSTPEGVALGLGVFAHIGLGTVIGVTAIVLGIIAIVTKRGRAYGIAGVSIAIAAPVISLIVYTLVGAVAAVASQ